MRIETWFRYIKKQYPPLVAAVACLVIKEARIFLKRRDFILCKTTALKRNNDLLLCIVGFCMFPEVNPGLI